MEEEEIIVILDPKRQDAFGGLPKAARFYGNVTRNTLERLRDEINEKLGEKLAGD